MAEISYPLPFSLYMTTENGGLVTGSGEITDISTYREDHNCRTFVHFHISHIDKDVRKALYKLRGYYGGEGPNIKMFFQLDWWHISLENLWPGSIDDDPNGPIKTMIYTDITDEKLCNSATLQRFLNTLYGSYTTHENIVAAVTRDRFARIG